MLHTQMQGANSLLDYLFYFFFPPPRDCLDEGAEAFRLAEVQVTVYQNTAASDLTIQTDCHYAPTVADFYAAQLSSGVEFQVRSGVEKVGGIYRQFYFLPMEKLESNGLTFYVFEAQGQTQFDLQTLDYFNFPDDLQGTQTDYFWAIGAPSPFPFYPDAQRKNVTLIQVAYAGVGLGPNERGYFMGLLKQMHLPSGDKYKREPISVFEPSHHFSISGHLWLAYRRIGIKRKRLDHAKTSRCCYLFGAKPHSRANPVQGCQA
jgi:hypothetical protein